MATKKKVKAAASKKAAPKKAVPAKGIKKKAASKAAPATASKKNPANKKTTQIPSKKKAAGKKTAPIASKKKTAVKKASPIIVKAKKAANNLAKKAISAISKALTKNKEYKPKTPVVVHGEDLHLIPVQGEIHPARRDDAALLEKQFRHNQQIAWQREQQHVRQIMEQSASRKVFRTPRQS